MLLFCVPTPPQVTGREYLDKVIHLPFAVPVMRGENRTDLVDGILSGGDNTVQSTIPRLLEATGKIASSVHIRNQAHGRKKHYVYLQNTTANAGPESAILCLCGSR